LGSLKSLAKDPFIVASLARFLSKFLPNNHVLSRTLLYVFYFLGPQKYKGIIDINQIDFDTRQEFHILFVSFYL